MSQFYYKLFAASLSWMSSCYNHSRALRAATGDLMCDYRQQAHLGRIRADCPAVCPPVFSQSLQELVTLYTCFQTQTVVDSANLSCSSRKTQPDSQVLRVVFFCLILLNIQASGDEMKSWQSLGFCKQKYCLFGLIVCFLLQWDLYDPNNDSYSNSMFSCVLWKGCWRWWELK